jgi:hypothetical protein
MKPDKPRIDFLFPGPSAEERARDLKPDKPELRISMQEIRGPTTCGAPQEGLRVILTQGDCSCIIGSCESPDFQVAAWHALEEASNWLKKGPINLRRSANGVVART